MTDTIEDLEAALEQAKDIAAKAEAKALAARHAAEERRQAAYQAHDEEVVAGYEPGPLDVEVSAAEQALRAAVLADPVHAAAAELYAARLRRRPPVRRQDLSGARPPRGESGSHTCCARAGDTARWPRVGVPGPLLRY